jgi:hypothetical protein
MNKIIHINLGGYALTIDEDAYEYLQAYLERIRRRFSESEGRDEIIRDVETRLWELITQNIGTNSIVMLLHVESAIEVMGKPEDFGGEGEDSFEHGSSRKSNIGSIRTGKKLFRDELTDQLMEHHAFFRYLRGNPENSTLVQYYENGDHYKTIKN